MLTLANQQKLCRSFAVLLSYPDATVRQTTADCLTQLNALQSSAAPAMEQFSAFVAGTDSSRLEELFTATFDLQPVCHPYVGYLLCGESQQRTLFLIKLQQLYKQHGFELGSELPDHLATLLRFVGTVDDRDCSQELIRDGLLPALVKLAEGLDVGQPYAELIQSLQSFLSETVDAGPELLAATGGRS